MTVQDLKIYVLNLLALSLSFSNVEAILRVMLLIISIIYTAWKLIEFAKTKKDD